MLLLPASAFVTPHWFEMLLPPELTRFIAWFAAFQGKVGERVGGVMHLPTGDGAAHPECATDLEWGSWLEAGARPTLRGMRVSVSDSLSLVTEAHPFTALAVEVTQAIQQLPDATTLDDVTSEGSTGTAEVPLRQWLEVCFAAEALPAFPELDRMLEHALHEMASKIEDIEGVLDYYTLAVQRHAAALEDAQAEEFARTGLTRVRSLIRDLDRRRAHWSRRALQVFVDHTANALEEASAPYRSHQVDAIRQKLEQRQRQRSAAPMKASVMRRAWRQSERSYRVALPLARQLASEVRDLFAEQEPRAENSGFRSLLLQPPAELGRKLPLGYRRLFTVVPLDSDELYVQRSTLEDACTRAIEDWRAGAPQSIVLHGDRGAGKRTLTNHVLARVRSQARLDVHWLRFGPNLCEESEVARSLGRALGMSAVPTRLMELRAAPADLLRRRVLVLENAERLLAPSPTGVAQMRDLLAVVGETAATTLWILLMATPAATFALQRLGFANRIPSILQVEPMTPLDLRAVITARHRLSGFDLEFAEPEKHLLDLLLHPVSSFRARAPGDAFYARLWTLTGGNPRQALYYWLAHARRHDQQEGQIVVEALPAGALEMLPALTLSQRLILALLARHDSLAKGDLVAALSLPSDSIDGDLRVLSTKGYLTPSSELARHFTLRPTMAHPLILELRSLNMI